MGRSSMGSVTRSQARPRRRLRLWLLAAVTLSLVAVSVVGFFGRVERPAGLVPPPDRPPGLADLWKGHASLVLARKWTSPSLGRPAGGAYEGADLEVVNGTWYLFNRRPTEATCAGRSGDVKSLATQVRASTDQGRTWGPPHDIVTPAPGTPWSCAATDGDAVFDAHTGTWIYLFQCLGDHGGWNGCVAERHETSPLGPFSVPSPDPNPVITSGQLWHRICAATRDRCHP